LEYQHQYSFQTAKVIVDNIGAYDIHIYQGAYITLGFLNILTIEALSF
jgi:hypothetical protein